ncbi:MAG: hypothetical protein ACI4A3_13585 [Lachnospiraceae bacterium]
MDFTIKMVSVVCLPEGEYMAYTKRKLEELNIMDDFLLNAIATDEEVGVPFCQEVLSVLLQRKIGAIRVVSQRTIPALSPKLRGIRMDVEVVEDLSSEGKLPAMNIYDLEPHIPDDTDMLRHNRFYQAKIDSRYLKSGERDFSKLPNLYVITILNYDPFGYDYMMYNICNQCKEVPELEYEDGLHYIYFYTDGTKGGTPEIKAMLNYFKESTQENVTNESTKKIHDYTNKVKIEPEVRDAYMTFEDKIYYERKDAAKSAALATTVQCICNLLEDYGPIPDELTDRLNDQKDINVLTKWLKLAAKADSIEEFVKAISEQDS